MQPSTLVGKIGYASHQWRHVRQVLDDSLLTFLKEDALTISASIAYFALLSIFPMLLLLVSLSGIYIRRFELNGQLTMVLESLLPMRPDFIMKELIQISKGFGRITLISIALLFWSSSGVFLPLERALDRAWEVEKSRRWWKSYLVAFEMAFLFGAFILVYAGVLSFSVYLQDSSSHWVQIQAIPVVVEFLFRGGFAVLAFGMTLGVFIILFKRLPNRYLPIGKVLPGAFLTALFWEGARTLFTLFLPRFNYSHIYGSVGVVVALMTWLYVSSVVTLFGAHVSHNLYKTLKEPAPTDAATVPPLVESHVQSASEVR
ncbi:MAG TPA: YihY/virulence factor BrkB family protein [Terriglobia bacterium]|nr:YihY/virulence factor BrkB family protein [Terriglobia bacterium]